MADIAKKYADEIQEIKKKVEDTQAYFNSNYERYHKLRNFVLKSSITSEEEEKLYELKKPSVEFNVLEAYIMRLRGEFFDQQPSFNVRANNDFANQATVKLVSEHMQWILKEANNNQFENQVFMDTLTGGFSVIEVGTKYKTPYSMDQIITLRRVPDTTLCGFDPLSNEPHKGDSRFCFHLFPMTEEEFKNKNPQIDLENITYNRTLGDFSWFYKEGNTKIVVVAIFYQKKKKKFKIHKLANNATITDKQYKKLISEWDNIAQIPEPIESRWTEVDEIWRYDFIGDQLIKKPTLTDFSFLPLIFVDGNSAILKDNQNSAPYQLTRPYIYQAIGAQRFKNFIGQTFAAEVENMEQHKWLVEQEAIPEKYVDGWLYPQIPGSLVWTSRNKDGVALPQPTPVPRVPLPPELYGSFKDTDSTIQNILGSYEASLGINNNQLSGRAIVKGATQSNMAATPYFMNFMAALNQAAQVILDLIPKYYVTPRTIPVIDKEGKRSFRKINMPSQNPTEEMAYTLFPHNTLNVTVSAGVNFKIQKNEAIEQAAKLSQAFPVFQQFINQKGLPFIIDNLDMKGAEMLKEEAQEFQKEMEIQQQKQQQNATQQQNGPMEQQMQLAAHQQMLNEKKLQTDSQLKSQELQLKEENIKNDRMKILMDASHSVESNNVQLTKSQTERDAKLIDLLIKEMNATEKLSKKESEGNERI